VGGCKLSILALWAGLLAATTTATAEPWRFIMTCDSRGNYVTAINEPALSELAAEILRRDVDFLIYPGDLVYGARVSPEQFEEQLWDWVGIMKPVYDAGIPVYVCRGNHEVGDAWDIEWGILPDPVDNYSYRWLRVFGNEEYPELKLPDNGPADAKYMSYSVVHKNALILAVDEYGGMRHRLAHAVDQCWVDSQFRANRQPHVFVFGHEPAFKMVHPDCLDDHPAQRDEFWRSLKRAGARTYFCGHDHFFNQARVDDGDGNPDNDVHQFVVATAGAPSYAWAPPYDGDNGDFIVTQVYHAERYGYILVEVDDLDVTMTWMERHSQDMLEPGVYRPAYVWSYRVASNPADPCPVKLTADLNGDCRVDFADLAILAGQWLAGDVPTGPADGIPK
jgi:3',5'-cyclic AMP phosphodiesterase CpdA